MGNRGRPPHAELLTPRESEVVKLVADGLTNFEIGERLGITGDAVRYHLKQVYQKLCLESREALVAWSRERRGWNAVRRALISVPAGLSAKGLLKVGAATAALGGAAAVVALGFGMAPFATGESCEIESPIIADNWTVTCVETLADLEDTFRRPLYPSEGYPVSPATGAIEPREFVQFAILQATNGEPVSFIRWEDSGGVGDEVSGPLSALAELPMGPRVEHMATNGMLGHTPDDIVWLAARPDPLARGEMRGSFVFGGGGPGIMYPGP